MSISNSALLVELNISVWTANKLDKAATADVLNQNQAAHGAAKVHKNLFAGTNKRKEIFDFASSCRQWHIARTLPWSDKGARLIPTSMFIDYKREIRGREDTFHRMVEEFFTAYPALMQTAHNYLGDLFNPDDYPDVSEIHNKFAFNYVFSPLPASGDFRLDANTQDLDDLREQYDKAFNTRVSEAMRDSWDRLHNMLQYMAGKLDDKDTDESKKKRWHETFLTNAQDLCDLLAHLNVTKDPALEQARKDLEASLRGVHIEHIKEHPSTRQDMKRNLDEILSKYEW